MDDTYHTYVSEGETMLVAASCDAEALDLFRNHARGRERVSQNITETNWYRRKYPLPAKAKRISGYQYLSVDECGGLYATDEFVEVPNRIYFITDILKDLEQNPV